MPEIPQVVEHVTQRLLAALDDEMSGFVEGFYLVGSVAFSDFRPECSDIDFVAVTSFPSGSTVTTAVRRAHARLPRGKGLPELDGIYVTWPELAADPRDLPPGVRVQGQRVLPRSSAGRHPVTWQEMREVALPLRGPPRAEVQVWTDQDALRNYSLSNLDTYWRRWWRRRRSMLSPAGAQMLGTWAPAWAVLGVSRLRYVLETGQLTSKTGAGMYARARLDGRWSPVIDECLRIRRGDQRTSPDYGILRRRQDALAMVEATIAELCGPATGEPAG